MKACVFVDGESFRHTIEKLFNKCGYRKEDYLPKNAQWADFFDHLVKHSFPTIDIVRMRTYWYVIATVDTWPPLPTSRELKNDPKKADEWYAKNKELIQRDAMLENAPCLQVIKELGQRRQNIIARFSGHHKIQRGIAYKHQAMEFRRSGAISYNLFSKELGKEKTVDVNLAVDMLQMRDIYDMVIIVSGDQDYLPAVQAVKNAGKTVINVAFSTQSGKLLPGGARRLNESTDWSLIVDYQTLAKYMGLEIAV